MILLILLSEPRLSNTGISGISIVVRIFIFKFSNPQIFKFLKHQFKLLLQLFHIVKVIFHSVDILVFLVPFTRH